MLPTDADLPDAGAPPGVGLASERAPQAYGVVALGVSDTFRRGRGDVDNAAPCSPFRPAAPPAPPAAPLGLRDRPRGRSAELSDALRGGGACGLGEGDGLSEPVVATRFRVGPFSGVAATEAGVPRPLGRARSTIDLADEGAGLVLSTASVGDTGLGGEVTALVLPPTLLSLGSALGTHASTPVEGVRSLPFASGGHWEGGLAAGVYMLTHAPATACSGVVGGVAILVVGWPMPPSPVDTASPAKVMPGRSAPHRNCGVFFGCGFPVRAARGDDAFSAGCVVACFCRACSKEPVITWGTLLSAGTWLPVMHPYTPGPPLSLFFPLRRRRAG